MVVVAVGGGRWWQQRSVVRRGEEREVHERLRSYWMKGKGETANQDPQEHTAEAPPMGCKPTLDSVTYNRNCASRANLFPVEVYQDAIAVDNTLQCTNTDRET